MITFMKQVMPHDAFCNGKKIVIENINVMSVMDNLVDHVIFRYTLFDINGVWGGEGSIELKGCECYDKWDATDKDAYEIVCNKIGLELLPNLAFKSSPIVEAK